MQRYALDRSHLYYNAVLALASANAKRADLIGCECNE